MFRSSLLLLVPPFVRAFRRSDGLIWISLGFTGVLASRVWLRLRFTSAYLYVCRYVCVCVHLYLFIYIYIYIYISICSQAYLCTVLLSMLYMYDAYIYICLADRLPIVFATCHGLSACAFRCT